MIIFKKDSIKRSRILYHTLSCYTGTEYLYGFNAFREESRNRLIADCNKNHGLKVDTKPRGKVLQITIEITP